MDTDSAIRVILRRPNVMPVLLVAGLVVTALSAPSCRSEPAGSTPDGTGEGAAGVSTVASRAGDVASSGTEKGDASTRTGPYHTATTEDGLLAEFFGQDGAGHAGVGCSTDAVPDNIRIRLSGLPADRAIAGYEVEDYTGSGRWVDPCNDANWWLVPLPAASGVVDLFMKPHRDAPEDTPYKIVVRYEDGTAAEVEVLGDLVLQDPSAGPAAKGGITLEFLGQDGAELAGEACADGDAPDNIHIRVSGMPAGNEVAGYQVDDFVGGGRWVHPCNDLNWWLVPQASETGIADLYFKPHGDTPDDTEYIVTVLYEDGTHHREVVFGSAVTTDVE